LTEFVRWYPLVRVTVLTDDRDRVRLICQECPRPNRGRQGIATYDRRTYKPLDLRTMQLPSTAFVSETVLAPV
jgi:hypothetical protein